MKRQWILLTIFVLLSVMACATALSTSQTFSFSGTVSHPAPSFSSDFTSWDLGKAKKNKFFKNYFETIHFTFTAPSVAASAVNIILSVRSAGGSWEGISSIAYEYKNPKRKTGTIVLDGTTTTLGSDITSSVAGTVLPIKFTVNPPRNYGEITGVLQFSIMYQG